MLLDDLRNPAQLLTVGMHEEEAILFALTAGCPVVFQPGQREESPLVPGEATSTGKFPVGNGPQAQQTPAAFQHCKCVLEFAGSERVDDQIDVRQSFPIVLRAVVYVAFNPHGEELLAGAVVTRYDDAKPQRSRYWHGHLSETSRSAGNQQRLSGLGLQHLDQPLPGRQSGQRNGGRHVERVSCRHFRYGSLRHDDIFGKSADPPQRQPCIDSITRTEVPDLASDPLDDT